MLETPNTPDPSPKGGEKKSDPATTNVEISNNQYDKLLLEYESQYRNLVEGQSLRAAFLKSLKGKYSLM